MSPPEGSVPARWFLEALSILALMNLQPQHTEPPHNMSIEKAYLKGLNYCCCHHRSKELEKAGLEWQVWQSNELRSSYNGQDTSQLWIVYLGLSVKYELGDTNK